MGRCAKHRWAGKKTGPNPTDRAKSGTKHSVIVESHGLPLGIVVAGANCPDLLLLAETLDAIVIPRPTPGPGGNNVCLDKGYEAPRCYAALAERGYVEHISTKHKAKQPQREIPGYRPRRWVVEACNSWFNRFRKILVSFEKLERTRLALMHLACAYIVFHRMRSFTTRADVS